MVNMGSKNIVIERDGWQCRTRDRKPSAHFEHTIAMVDDRPEILTTFKFIEDAIRERGGVVPGLRSEHSAEAAALAVDRNTEKEQNV